MLRNTASFPGITLRQLNFDLATSRRTTTHESATCLVSNIIPPVRIRCTCWTLVWLGPSLIWRDTPSSTSTLPGPFQTLNRRLFAAGHGQDRQTVEPRLSLRLCAFYASAFIPPTVHSSLVYLHRFETVHSTKPKERQPRPLPTRLESSHLFDMPLPSIVP